MSRWVLILLTNTPYYTRALQTIRDVRGCGRWQEDIVLMISEDLTANEELLSFSKEFNVQLRIVPARDCSIIFSIWEDNKNHADYHYLMNRRFIFNKFFIFDSFFRRWDYVFYIDAGMNILAPLTRFIDTCNPSGRLLAHSDAYPTQEWTLQSQFCHELLTKEQKEKLAGFDLTCDYFQTTMMIFDTCLITDSLVDTLFSLAYTFPCTRRGDQGILNLYFTCQLKKWEQIPLHDEIGFLYDYHERNGYIWSDYAMLKSKLT